MKKHIELTRPAAALDRELDPNKMQDHCHNGLQVARRDPQITRVCLGVDAPPPLDGEAVSGRPLNQNAAGRQTHRGSREPRARDRQPVRQTRKGVTRANP